MSSPSKNHVIAAPVFLYGLRIAQLVVAVAILGLCGYGVTYLSFDGDSLMLFTAIATIIITVYIGVASIAAPIIYNYWAILGLDIFAIVFWVISFSLLASEVATYNNDVSYCAYYFDGVCYRKAKRGTTTVTTYKNAMAAAAGLGGLEFLLFVITLVIFSIHLHRHRKAGGHCVPNSAAPAFASDRKEAEAQQEQEQPQQPQHQVPVQNQPQQQYPVQSLPEQTQPVYA